MTVDPNIVMSAVTAVEITKYSIAYQWSAVPNATSYYVYKYDTVQEKYDFYTVTTGTSIQVAGLAAVKSIILHFTQSTIRPHVEAILLYHHRYLRSGEG